MAVRDLDRLISAQAAVLGCILIEPDLCGEIFARVQDDDFVTPEYRNPFAAARRLFFGGKQVDAVTVCYEAGGDAYRSLLMQVIDITPTASGWEAYVDILLEQSKLHRLYTLAGQLRECGTLEEAQDLLCQAQMLINRAPKARIVSMTQGLVDFLGEIDHAPAYIPTGIDRLDKLLGISPGDMIVLGGYPSAGKTAMAIQMAHRMSREKRVGFFSLETGDRKIYARLFSQAAMLDFGAIKQRRLPEEDITRLIEHKDSLAGCRLDVIDAAGMTVADIQSIALAQRYDVIFMDYLQLIRSAGRTANRAEEVAQISRAVHTMAQGHKIAAVALSQLSRPEKSHERQKAPTMSSLRESGQIEQDADAVLLLYLTNPEDPRSDRRLKIAKNKEGELGAFDLHFDGKHQQFIAYMDEQTGKSAMLPPYKRPEPERQTKIGDPA